MYSPFCSFYFLAWPPFPSSFIAFSSLLQALSSDPLLTHSLNTSPPLLAHSFHSLGIITSYFLGKKSISCQTKEPTFVLDLQLLSSASGGMGFRCLSSIHPLLFSVMSNAILVSSSLLFATPFSSSPILSSPLLLSAGLSPAVLSPPYRY